MDAESASVGREAFTHVQDLRDFISKEQLVIFVGEQLSILRDQDLPAKVVTEDNPNLEGWWQSLPLDLDGHVVLEKLQDLEEQYVASLPDRELRELGILRRLGRFPLVLTTNLDCLLDPLCASGGRPSQKLRIDQVEPLVEAWPEKVRHNLLVKLFGDSCYTTRIQCGIRPFVEGLLHSTDERNCAVAFLQKVFNTRSVLFIGCDMSTTFYRQLTECFTVKSKVKHFSYEAGKPSLINRGQLTMIRMDMPIWEFLSYLSPGSIEKTFQQGQSWERFYLVSQRESYLKQQLVLEEQALAITYITASITNALATDELLEKVSRKKLASIYDSDPFGIGQEEKAQLVDDAYQAMVNRRDNLLKMIREGKTQITSLFFFDEFCRELMAGSPEQRAMMVRKYGQALLLCNSFLRSASPFHLSVLPKMTMEELDEMKKDAFAYIELHSGEDKAICYADTAGADRNRHQVQIIALNNQETINRKRIVDLRLARAWDSQTSFEKVLGITMQVDRELDALDPKTREKLQQLDSLQVLTTDHNVDVASLTKIGSGNFGSVYRGLYNGEEVAYKVMNEGTDATEAKLKDFLREFETLQRCNHENVVAVKHCFRIGTRFGLAMEFVDGWNLRKVIDEEGAQTPDFTMLCAQSIGQALAHLHQNNIIHRDVKPDNVLVTNDRLTVKLGDFGLARAFDSTLESKTELKGAWRYMAPEVMVSRQYTTKADVYSYGCVLVELVSGRVAMHDIENHKEAGIAKLRNVKPKIPTDSAARYGRPLVTAMELCFETAKSRPEISRIMNLIKGEDATLALAGLIVDPLVEIVCLGTGQGTTAVLYGKPSSSFVVMYKSRPAVLIDIGAGVTRSFLEVFGEDFTSFPPYIFISHNHFDHAGELPVVLSMRYKIRCKHPALPKPTIVAGLEVEQKLHSQRLDEVASVASSDDLARWVSVAEGHKMILNEFPPLRLSVHRSRHSEICYGFILYHKNEPIFSYTGDSGFDEGVYKTAFQAPLVLLDGRQSATVTAEHASRDDQTVFITGYGREEDVSDEQSVPSGCKLFFPQDRQQVYPLPVAAAVHARQKTEEIHECVQLQLLSGDGNETVGTVPSGDGNSQSYPPPDSVIAGLAMEETAQPEDTMGSKPYPGPEQVLANI